LAGRSTISCNGHQDPAIQKSEKEENALMATSRNVLKVARDDGIIDVPVTKKRQRFGER
jgi:hypothetical protein